ncbi:sulfotransferase family protein [Leptothoe kymatousa]|uniref:Sulfotransferase n=1 Tax=Leptothoe kymatousa TAU-MAC 1615 TaxID=2364775 RepID=A0ABS5Y0G2_9CYAN|nr:sulfotransferase [Leptothoe kymatousa]MBT9311317.1 sulfotransferase [Leptothoe kymatousa TAU-MAC 1615]
MPSPLILVGLPRSGSTLVSRILNESLNCFIINDFYYLQYVESVDGFAQSNPTIKGLLVDFIVTQVKNRTKPEDLDDEVWFGLPFSAADLQELDRFAEAYKANDESRTWAQVLEDIMQFLAELSHKPMWGYNTPQDYLNFNIISEAFADAKFIFLLRSPLATLLSYKYYWTVDPKFRDDRGRYHPVIQALAWKTCATTYFGLLQEHGHDRFMLVKFEEVLSNTKKVLADISRFSGIEFAQVDLTSFGHNSSLSDKGSAKNKKRITALEERIGHFLTHKVAHELGYGNSPLQPLAVADVFNLLATTGRNGAYYFRQIVFSRNVRKRVVKFVSQMLSQAGQKVETYSSTIRNDAPIQSDVV